MTLKRSGFVLIAILAFVFSTYGYVEPDSPFPPEPADVIAYTYTDSYWDVVPTGNEEGYFTDENNEVLPIYKNATFDFYGTATSDYNPWAQTQCQWNQNMILLDMTMQQLLMMDDFTSLGTTTMGRWDLTGSPDSAFQFSINVGIDSCGPTMPQVPLGGVGGIIIDGISGTSHSRYIKLVFVPGVPQYKHSARHLRETCPAKCALRIPEQVSYFGSITDPPPQLDLQLPFDKNGACADVKWEYEFITRDDCYNTYDHF